jgi:hypothetical protein
LQQWLRDQIRQVFSLPEADVTSRSMGASGTDVLLSPAAGVLFPFAIECKAQESVSIWEAWRQTKSNVSEQLPFPLLVIKRNNEEPLAVLDAELFIRLMGELPRG